MNSLPPELDIAIIDSADVRDLKSCRLIHPSFRDHATQRLFTVVNLSTSTDSVDRLKAIAHQPQLARLVKKLTFCSNFLPYLAQYAGHVNRTITEQARARLPKSLESYHKAYCDLLKSHQEFRGRFAGDCQFFALLVEMFPLFSNVRGVESAYGKPPSEGACTDKIARETLFSLCLKLWEPFCVLAVMLEAARRACSSTQIRVIHCGHISGRWHDSTEPLMPMGSYCENSAKSTSTSTISRPSSDASFWRPSSVEYRSCKC